jgi:hypothetical protein
VTDIDVVFFVACDSLVDSQRERYRSRHKQDGQDQTHSDTSMRYFWNWMPWDLVWPLQFLGLWNDTQMDFTVSISSILFESQDYYTHPLAVARTVGVDVAAGRSGCAEVTFTEPGRKFGVEVEEERSERAEIMFMYGTCFDVSPSSYRNVLGWQNFSSFIIQLNIP